MSSKLNHFDPETLQQLDGLLLRGRSLIDGFMAGVHRTPKRGQAVEFAEHRPYSHGDDLRRIDWKVFGRRDEYFVKRFEDETNLVCAIVVDRSSSMAFPSLESARRDRRLTKKEYADLLALTLAYFLFQNRDAAALVTYSESIEQFVEPTTQPSRWLDMVRVLEMPTNLRGTKPLESVTAIVSRLPKRCLTIWISDFLFDSELLAKSCRAIKACEHDVILMQILDPIELNFPFSSLSEFVDLENDQRQTVDPHSIRHAYLDQLNRHQESISALATQLGIDYQLFQTNQSLSSVLPRFVAARERARQGYRSA